MVEKKDLFLCLYIEYVIIEEDEKKYIASLIYTTYNFKERARAEILDLHV